MAIAPMALARSSSPPANLDGQRIGMLLGH
jgi:hypothetical protein